MTIETFPLIALVAFIALQGALVFMGFNHLNTKFDLLIGVLLKQNQHVDTLIKLMSLLDNERLPYLQKQIYPPAQYPEMYKNDKSSGS